MSSESDKPKTIERELGEINTHLQYLRRGFDNMDKKIASVDTFLATCPGHREAIDRQISALTKKVNSNSKTGLTKKQWTTISGLIAALTVIVREVIQFVWKR